MRYLMLLCLCALPFLTQAQKSNTPTEAPYLQYKVIPAFPLTPARRAYYHQKRSPEECAYPGLHFQRGMRSLQTADRRNAEEHG